MINRMYKNGNKIIDKIPLVVFSTIEKVSMTSKQNKQLIDLIILDCEYKFRGGFLVPSRKISSYGYFSTVRHKFRPLFLSLS